LNGSGLELNTNMNEEEYFPGKGCQCYAHSENECACNVDWTEPEVYELREENEKLKDEIKKLKLALENL
jgi:hypothetical protein